MLPKAVHLDFEKALNKGFANTFPTTTILNDFFHFIQVNVKKVQWLRINHSEIHNIVVDLNTLWYKVTKAEFDTYLKKFTSNWDKKEPQYIIYFRSTWLNLYLPMK
jgi:hypothetical protein